MKKKKKEASVNTLRWVFIFWVYLYSFGLAVKLKFCDGNLRVEYMPQSRKEREENDCWSRVFESFSFKFTFHFLLSRLRC